MSENSQKIMIITIQLFPFPFKRLADAFIQSDLQCIQGIHLLSVCVGLLLIIIIIY